MKRVTIETTNETITTTRIVIENDGADSKIELLLGAAGQPVSITEEWDVLEAEENAAAAQWALHQNSEEELGHDDQALLDLAEVLGRPASLGQHKEVVNFESAVRAFGPREEALEIASLRQAFSEMGLDGEAVRIISPEQTEANLRNLSAAFDLLVIAYKQGHVSESYLSAADAEVRALQEEFGWDLSGQQPDGTVVVKPLELTT